MHLGDEGIAVVVLWSVGFVLRVDVRMHFKADSECVEVVEVENFEFCHDWFGVCSWWVVFEEPNDFLLGFDERLNEGFARVVRAPDGDIAMR